MFKNIKSLLAPSAPKTVAITLRKNCRVQISNGTMIDGTEGEVYQVSEAVAAQLIGQAVAEDPAAELAAVEKTKSLAALLPAAHEPQELPASWENLPACFAKWHELNQEALGVIYRRDDIERVLIERVSRGIWSTSGDLNKLSPEMQRSVVLKMDIGVEKFSPEEVAAQRYLRDALQRASESADRWNEANQHKLFCLRVECSDAVMKIHGELSRTCRDLTEIGFDIFKARISALGLGDGKVATLYAGSSDFIKYQAAADAPTLQDLKSLWYQDGGKDQRLFIDRSPYALAQSFIEWTARNAELQKLLANGRKELAAAKRVSQAA